MSSAGLHFSVGSQARLAARAVAFYLPQFHPIPENDAWWGRGFTEWTNLAKARPLFRGHYQPHIPADLGFYDLRLPETRHAQADMARAYGIEGFCYWHYWFAGERLLERPFEEVLASGEPDFPFCLAWANDSWTGIWYGAPKRVLKEQTYPGISDHEAHFHALLPAFTDRRYITVDGKPLFVVYRPKQLPDAVRVTDLWRNLAHQVGLPGIYLVGVAYDEAWDPRQSGFDAVTLSFEQRMRWRMPESGLARQLRRVHLELIERPAVRYLYERGLHRPIHVYAYRKALRYFVEQREFHWEYCPMIVPNWDNTPRCGLQGTVLHESTPELFGITARTAALRVAGLPAEHRIVFVKSWNEWAEGNHLEPDLRYGTKYLEVLREVLCET